MNPIVGLVINSAIVGALGVIGYSHAKDFVKKLNKPNPPQKETITDFSNYRWPVSKAGETTWDVAVTMKSVKMLRSIKVQYRPYENIEPDDKVIDKRVPKEILTAVVLSTGIPVGYAYSKWDIIALLNNTDRRILMLLVQQHLEDTIKAA